MVNVIIMAEQKINMSKECKQARNIVVLTFVVFIVLITIISNI